MPARAEALGIELWDFRRMLGEISQAFSDRRTYFTDDTLRTLHLFALAQDSNRSTAESVGSERQF